MRCTDRVPLVMMLEGAGFRADGKAHTRSPTDLLAQARCSGRVPLVTAVLGASAGHGALVAPMSDFAVMSSGASVFTAGPPVVLESLGEQISKEDLGGPGVALASGLIHNVATDDAAALGLVRTYLRYFPSSAWSYPLDLEGGDDGFRPVPELLDIIPLNGRRVYDMHEVVDVVFDDGSCFEVQPEFGRSVICRSGPARRPPRGRRGKPTAGPGRGHSTPTALTRPLTSSRWPIHSICRSSFSPTIPGSCRGASRSGQGILRSGARMYAAQTQARVPKMTVTLRKAYGFGSMVMGMIPFDGQSATFAFPGATMGAMGAAAMSRARGSDVDEAALLRQLEVEASYRSARELRPGRAHQPGRDPQPATAVPRACPLPAPGHSGAGRPDCDHAVKTRP